MEGAVLIRSIAVNMYGGWTTMLRFFETIGSPACSGDESCLGGSLDQLAHWQLKDVLAGRVCIEDNLST